MQFPADNGAFGLAAVVRAQRDGAFRSEEAAARFLRESEPFIDAHALASAAAISSPGLPAMLAQRPFRRYELTRAVELAAMHPRSDLGGPSEGLAQLVAAGGRVSGFAIRKLVLRRETRVVHAALQLASLSDAEAAELLPFLRDPDNVALLAAAGHAVPASALLAMERAPQLVAAAVPMLAPDTDPVELLALGEGMLTTMDVNGALELFTTWSPLVHAALSRPGDLAGRPADAGLRDALRVVLRRAELDQGLAMDLEADLRALAALGAAPDDEMWLEAMRSRGRTTPRLLDAFGAPEGSVGELALAVAGRAPARPGLLREAVEQRLWPLVATLVAAADCDVDADVVLLALRQPPHPTVYAVLEAADLVPSTRSPELVDAALRSGVMGAAERVLDALQVDVTPELLLAHQTHSMAAAALLDRIEDAGGDHGLGADADALLLLAADGAVPVPTRLLQSALDAAEALSERAAACALRSPRLRVDVDALLAAAGPLRDPGALVDAAARRGPHVMARLVFELGFAPTPAAVAALAVDPATPRAWLAQHTSAAALRCALLNHARARDVQGARRLLALPETPPLTPHDLAAVLRDGAPFVRLAAAGHCDLSRLTSPALMFPTRGEEFLFGTPAAPMLEDYRSRGLAAALGGRHLPGRPLRVVCEMCWDRSLSPDD